VFDNAWVYGDARVCGDARVYDNARVCGDARVFDNARVCGDAWVCQQGDLIILSCCGSEFRYGTTATRDQEGNIFIACGCWYGSIDDFEERVKKVHGGKVYETEYLSFAQIVRAHFAALPIEENK
jgi:hypothetical protein